jgi:dimethylamine/trimethylamine dehydrogenase
VITVTARLPDDALYQDLLLREAEWSKAGVRSVCCIGDADAPGLIAHAVYAGHRYARALDEPVADGVPFKRHFHTGRATDLRRAQTAGAGSLLSE